MAKDTFEKFHPDEFKVAMQGLLTQAELCKVQDTPEFRKFLMIIAKFEAQQAANMRQLSNIIHRKTK